MTAISVDCQCHPPLHSANQWFRSKFELVYVGPRAQSEKLHTRNSTGWRCFCQDLKVITDVQAQAEERRGVSSLAKILDYLDR